MGTSAHATPASITAALALLTFPALDTLTGRQVRGTACVWDERHTLTAGIAVSLGVMEASRAGEPVKWYPRACRDCTFRAANEQLHAHCTSGNCPNDGQCPMCKGLNRVIREYRR